MDFDRFPGDMEIPDDSYFVIATYGHHHDEAVLKRLYESVPKPAYIGMIASRKKREIILKSVKKAFPEADTGVCYIPAGLDIGGSLPHEIAVSVIAEIQAVSSGKEAKHLREAHD
jgi:xanthine/CO dehydrogenase XdhC/CoxF family maturation factor